MTAPKGYRVKLFPETKHNQNFARFNSIVWARIALFPYIDSVKTKILKVSLKT